MIPFLTMFASLAFMVLAVVVFFARDLGRKARLAWIQLGVACIALLNALGNLDAEWVNALIFVFVNVPISVIGVRVHGRALEEARLSEEARR